ncbi:MAG: hypothetical protein U9R00_02065 [Patescibacteria group bacterium]|nr:hypothetical protein [Patescibacteria group bacterium]
MYKFGIMQIVKEHETSKGVAIGKIDNFLNDLMKKQFPGGVKIKNPQKKWNGNVMDFSFEAKTFFAGTTINSGTIRVTDTQVTLNSTNMPGFIRTFVSEEKLKEVIVKQFDELFKNQ